MIKCTKCGMMLRKVAAGVAIVVCACGAAVAVPGTAADPLPAVTPYYSISGTGLPTWFDDSMPHDHPGENWLDTVSDGVTTPGTASTTGRSRHPRYYGAGAVPTN